jgi:hypothetical protein
MFVLNGISFLIGDEFLDGELTDESVNTQTSFSQLKKLRKSLKLALSSEDEKDRKFPENVPGELAYYRSMYDRIILMDKPRYAYAVGVISQTRGCGTPPPLVILQSKIKFLQTVTEPPAPLTQEERCILRAGVSSVLSELPDEAFTGLVTKARISVTTSACFEETKKAGGTLSAIQKIVQGGIAGKVVSIRDLDTGKVVDSKGLKNLTPGEFVFWACLDKTLKTPLDELRKAWLVVVKEPGKGRAVTKAHAYLKVVLDLVNKICSEPLRKGVESSRSGMGKSSHGWNLFEDFFSEETKDILFHQIDKSEEKYADHKDVKVVYDTVYALSTDYETATDFMLHEFSEICAMGWMSKCGIPPILKGIVVATCYRPREIFFTATGPLKKYGTYVDENTRKVLLVRGVLMGDPLTKIVLHMTNILTRNIASNWSNPSWWSTTFENPVQHASRNERKGP